MELFNDFLLIVQRFIDGGDGIFELVEPFCRGVVRGHEFAVVELLNFRGQTLVFFQNGRVLLRKKGNSKSKKHKRDYRNDI
jgi:hypothetical protein